MARRRRAIPFLAWLGLCCVVSRHPGAFTGLGAAAPRALAAERRCLGSRGWLRAGAATALGARGGDEDSVTVSGYSGLVVGAALMPHVIYILYVAYGILAQGVTPTYGPYGITVISGLTTVGLTMWSLGSVVSRGRGLPAGPLGLLGLAEGLSYLGTLAAVGVLLTRMAAMPGGLSLPKLEGLSLPNFEVAEIKAPEFKAPDIKAPEVKAPEIKASKAPDIKAPEVKAPEIKAPKVSEVKAPEVKLPDFKAPELKLPDFKAPEFSLPGFKAPELKLPDFKADAPKPSSEPKPAPKAEAPKPAPKAAAPAPASKAGASFSDLFDD